MILTVLVGAAVARFPPLAGDCGDLWERRRAILMNHRVAAGKNKFKVFGQCKNLFLH